MANLTNVALGLQARSLAVHQITMSLTGISSFDNIEERSWTELVAMHVKLGVSGPNTDSCWIHYCGTLLDE